MASIDSRTPDNSSDGVTSSSHGDGHYIIEGTNGDDTVVGTGAGDEIKGSLGNDLIYGAGKGTTGQWSQDLDTVSYTEDLYALNRSTGEQVKAFDIVLNDDNSVSVTRNDLTGNGDASTDILHDIGRITFGKNDNTVEIFLDQRESVWMWQDWNGDARRAFSIEGGIADDLIQGSDQQDWLKGGAGNDIILADVSSTATSSIIAGGGDPQNRKMPNTDDGTSTSFTISLGEIPESAFIGVNSSNEITSRNLNVDLTSEANISFIVSGSGNTSTATSALQEADNIGDFLYLVSLQKTAGFKIDLWVEHNTTLNVEGTDTDLNGVVLLNIFDSDNYSSGDRMEGGEGNDFMDGGLKGNQTQRTWENNNEVKYAKNAENYELKQITLASAAGSETTFNDGTVISSWWAEVRPSDSSTESTTFSQLVTNLGLSSAPIKAGVYVIVNDLKGDDGIDILANVQRIDFGDGGVLLETEARTIDWRGVSEPGTQYNGSLFGDLITGTSDYDEINSQGGNDIVIAGAGGDRINSGTGNDYVDGGASGSQHGNRWQDADEVRFSGSAKRYDIKLASQAEVEAFWSENFSTADISGLTYKADQQYFFVNDLSPSFGNGSTLLTNVDRIDFEDDQVWLNISVEARDANSQGYRFASLTDEELLVEGTQFNDTVIAADVMAGRSAKDLWRIEFNGKQGDDVFIGDDMGSHVQDSAGNDMIIGGGSPVLGEHRWFGQDEVSFNGLQARYTIEQYLAGDTVLDNAGNIIYDLSQVSSGTITTADGTAYSITDTSSKIFVVRDLMPDQFEGNGINLLMGVERVNFEDGGVNLAAEMYENTWSDQTSVDYVREIHARGTTFNDIINTEDTNLANDENINNWVEADDGNDYVFTGGGGDEIRPGKGNDFVDGGAAGTVGDSWKRSDKVFFDASAKGFEVTQATEAQVLDFWSTNFSAQTFTYQSTQKYFFITDTNPIDGYGTNLVTNIDRINFSDTNIKLEAQVNAQTNADNALDHYHIVGTGFDDVITSAELDNPGSVNVNTDAGAGNDVLIGSAERNHFFGQTGNDLIVGGDAIGDRDSARFSSVFSRYDVAAAKAGDIIYQVKGDSSSAVIYDLSKLSDGIVITQDGTEHTVGNYDNGGFIVRDVLNDSLGGAGIDLLLGIEQMDFSDANKNLTADLSDNNRDGTPQVHISLNDYNSTFDASAGVNDSAEILTTSGSIDGNAGDDIIIGFTHGTQFKGGSGNDLLLVADGVQPSTDGTWWSKQQARYDGPSTRYDLESGYVLMQDGAPVLSESGKAIWSNTALSGYTLATRVTDKISDVQGGDGQDILVGIEELRFEGDDSEVRINVGVEFGHSTDYPGVNLNDQTMAEFPFFQIKTSAVGESIDLKTIVDAYPHDPYLSDTPFSFQVSTDSFRVVDASSGADTFIGLDNNSQWSTSSLGDDVLFFDGIYYSELSFAQGTDAVLGDYVDITHTPTNSLATDYGTNRVYNFEQVIFNEPTYGGKINLSLAMNPSLEATTWGMDALNIEDSLFDDVIDDTLLASYGANPYPDTLKLLDINVRGGNDTVDLSSGMNHVYGQTQSRSDFGDGNDNISTGTGADFYSLTKDLGEYSVSYFYDSNGNQAMDTGELISLEVFQRDGIANIYDGANAFGTAGNNEIDLGTYKENYDAGNIFNFDLAVWERGKGWFDYKDDYYVQVSHSIPSVYKGTGIDILHDVEMFGGDSADGLKILDLLSGNVFFSNDDVTTKHEIGSNLSLLTPETTDVDANIDPLTSASTQVSFHYVDGKMDNWAIKLKSIDSDANNIILGTDGSATFSSDHILYNKVKDALDGAVNGGFNVTNLLAMQTAAANGDDITTFLQDDVKLGKGYDIYDLKGELGQDEKGAGWMQDYSSQDIPFERFIFSYGNLDADGKIPNLEASFTSNTLLNAYAGDAGSQYTRIEDTLNDDQGGMGIKYLVNIEWHQDSSTWKAGSLGPYHIDWGDVTRIELELNDGDNLISSVQIPGVKEALDANVIDAVHVTLGKGDNIVIANEHAGNNDIEVWKLDQAKLNDTKALFNISKVTVSLKADRSDLTRNEDGSVKYYQEGEIAENNHQLEIAILIEDGRDSSEGGFGTNLLVDFEHMNFSNDQSMDLVYRYEFNPAASSEDSNRLNIQGTDLNDLISLDATAQSLLVDSGSPAAVRYEFKGNAGNDIIIGTDSGDQLEGGAGDDILIGHGNGTSGNEWHDLDQARYSISSLDRLDVSVIKIGFNATTNELLRGADQQVVTAPTDTQLTSGYSLTKAFKVDDKVSDELGGLGSDILINVERININGQDMVLGSSTVSHDWNDDGIEDRAEVIGSDFNDVISPTTQGGDIEDAAFLDRNNNINAAAGDDNVYAGGGGDWIRLSTGNDFVDGGSNLGTNNWGGDNQDEVRFTANQSNYILNSTVFAGVAEDVLDLSNNVVFKILSDGQILRVKSDGVETALAQIELGDRYTTVQDQTPSGALGGEGTNLLIGIENINFEDAHLRLEINEGQNLDEDGNVQHAWLEGTSLGDVLIGHEYNEDIRGYGGNDLLYGGAGGDRLNGGEGDDILIGGANGTSGDNWRDLDQAEYWQYSSAQASITKTQVGLGADGKSLLLDTNGEVVLDPTAIQLGASYTATSAFQIASTAGFGTDTLVGVERLSFKDQQIDLLITSREDDWNNDEIIDWSEISGTAMTDVIGNAAHGGDLESRLLNTDNYINAKGGDDSIWAMAGGDDIRPGSGNDYINGGTNGTNDGSGYIRKDGVNFSGAESRYVINSFTFQDEAVDIKDIDDTVVFKVLSDGSIMRQETSGNHTLLDTLTSGQTITQVTDLMPGGVLGGEGVNLMVNVEYLNFDGSSMGLEVERNLQHDSQGNITNSWINGTSNGDIGLTGTIVGDSINGNAGNDTLIGLQGNDHFTGGTGDDIIWGDLQNSDEILAGQDVARFEGLQKQFSISRVDSTINGKQYQAIQVTDLLAASLGGAGTDTLYGIEALSFNDSWIRVGVDIHEQKDSNGNVIERHYNGSQFDDVINGSDLTDSLNGGAGNDQLTGGAGGDHFKGGEGNDTIYGGAEGIDAWGNARVDSARFIGKWSEYTIQHYNSIGSTTSTFDEDGYVTVQVKTDDGSGDIDTLHGIERLEFSDRNVSFASAQSFTDANGDGIPDWAEIRGTEKADTLTGSDLNDVIYGDAGNDTITGGKGDDILSGDEGINTIDGGNGSDVFGNTYVDTAKFNGKYAEYSISNVSNTWTVSLTADTVDTLTNIEVLEFSDMRLNLVTDVATRDFDKDGSIDFVHLTGTLGDNIFNITDNTFGNSGWTLPTNASSVDYYLNLGAGDDMATLGSGDDTIFDHLGTDRYDGGDGFDTLQLVGKRSDWGVFSVEASDGSRTIEDADSNNIKTLTNIEQVQFSDKMTVLTATTTQLDTNADGSADTMLYAGTELADSLNAEEDPGLSWILNGNIGDDYLIGGSANDRLNGGDGSDHLSGGAGNDTAVFNALTEAATITQVKLTSNVSGLAEDSVSGTFNGFKVTVNGGSDLLLDMEVIEFSDGLISLTKSEEVLSSFSLSSGLVDTRYVTGTQFDDTLNSSSYQDEMTGGAGNDTFVLAESSYKTVTVTDFAGLNSDGAAQDILQFDATDDASLFGINVVSWFTADTDIATGTAQLADSDASNDVSAQTLIDTATTTQTDLVTNILKLATFDTDTGNTSFRFSGDNNVYLTQVAEADLSVTNIDIV